MADNAILVALGKKIQDKNQVPDKPKLKVKKKKGDFSPILSLVEPYQRAVEAGEMDIKDAAKSLISDLAEFLSEENSEKYADEIMNTKIKNPRLEEEE